MPTEGALDREPAASTNRVPAWAGLAMVAGGLLHVVVWPVFTTLHGPTSFNRERDLLGVDALLWGTLMEGPSGLLIAAGLGAAYPLLVAHRGRAARIGFWMAIAGLALPAVAAFVMRGPFPPLLAPLLGLGLVLLAYASGSVTMEPLHRRLLALLGATQLFAFLWTAAVPLDLADRIDGYRIYGLVANVLFGMCWIALGISLAADSKNDNGMV